MVHYLSIFMLQFYIKHVPDSNLSIALQLCGICIVKSIFCFLIVKSQLKEILNLILLTLQLVFSRNEFCFNPRLQTICESRTVCMVPWDLCIETFSCKSKNLSVQANQISLSGNTNIEEEEDLPNMKRRGLPDLELRMVVRRAIIQSAMEAYIPHTYKLSGSKLKPLYTKECNQVIIEQKKAQ